MMASKVVGMVAAVHQGGRDKKTFGGPPKEEAGA
jgi:hypothetical protein